MDQLCLRLPLVQTRSRSLVLPNRTISGPTPTRLCSRVAAHRPPVDLRSLSQPTQPHSSLHRSRPWHQRLRRHLHLEQETSLLYPSHKSSESTRPTTTTFGTYQFMCLARIRTMRKILSQDRNRIIVKCFISSLRQCILWTIQRCQERILHRHTNTRP